MWDGRGKKEYEMVSSPVKNWVCHLLWEEQFSSRIQFDVQNLRNIKRHGEMLCKIKQIDIEVKRELWAGMYKARTYQRRDGI